MRRDQYWSPCCILRFFFNWFVNCGFWLSIFITLPNTPALLLLPLLLLPFGWFVAQFWIPDCCSCCCCFCEPLFWSFKRDLLAKSNIRIGFTNLSFWLWVWMYSCRLWTIQRQMWQVSYIFYEPVFLKVII